MRLDDVSVRPRGRVEAEARDSAPINQELLKVPRNVVGSDGVVHKLLSFADTIDRLRAGLLQKCFLVVIL